MAFPPNYNQERNNRSKAKQRKAIDKQNKRDEKNAARKSTDEQQTDAVSENKDQD